MRNKKRTDDLKEMIVNNPRAIERVETKRISKEVDEFDKKFENQDKYKNSLWQT